MKRCLARIRVLMLLAASMFVQNASAQSENMQYGMVMTARGHEVTGICVIESGQGGSLVGSVVNEFGVKAFDFIYDKGKTKVLNVIKPLNKWYIRRVLRRDLNNILPEVSGKKELTGEQVFKRSSRTYIFTPMEQEQ